MSNLKEAIKGVFGRKALTSGASTETVSLQYTPLLLDQLHTNYDSKLLADLDGPIRAEVKKYCEDRHVRPIDLAFVGAQILASKQSSPLKESFCIFFPIYRGGVTVAGWTRPFGGNTKWLAVGMSDGNGSLLYTTALPDWAFNATHKNSGESPLILVEGVMDAIRLNKAGHLGVALGGKNITAKGRAELIAMPQQMITIFLDKDAQKEAVQLMQKVQVFKKEVRMIIWPSDVVGKDPAELDDSTLKEMLNG